MTQVTADNKSNAPAQDKPTQQNPDSGLSGESFNGRTDFRAGLSSGVTTRDFGPTPDYEQGKDYYREARNFSPDEKEHGYAPSTFRYSTAPSVGTDVKGSAYHRFGRSDLTPDAERAVGAVVDKIKELQKANGGQLPPGTTISVEGFTDDMYHGKHTSSPEGIAFNKELSQQRADAIKQLIMKETGLSEQDITATGQGISKDHSNETKEGRAQNRRVDIEVSVPKETKAEVVQAPKPEAKIDGKPEAPDPYDPDNNPDWDINDPTQDPDRPDFIDPSETGQQPAQEPTLEPVKSSFDPFVPLRDTVDKKLEVISSDGLTQYQVERVQIGSQHVSQPGIGTEVPTFGYRVSALGVDPAGPPAPLGSMMYKPGEGWTERTGNFVKSDAVTGVESALEAANNKAAFERLLKANAGNQEWATDVGDHLAKVVQTNAGIDLYVYTPPTDGIGMRLNWQTDFGKFARFSYDAGGNFVQAKGNGGVDPRDLNLSDIQRRLWLE